jgi:CMP-N,N'-diacetyllegionaminic acid synthase
MSMVALIPARSGSKRIPNKNIKLLEGHPLLAYSIRSAIDSGVFDKIICATDSEEYAEIAIKYGAEVPKLRSKSISEDNSPDIEWVKWMLDLIDKKGDKYSSFSILRPTSPFRKAETIRRAYNQFTEANNIDSIRAVEKCGQHPGKMWIIRNNTMCPLLPLSPEAQPWHSSQYSALPVVFVQNASLEMAWTRTVRKLNTIAGNIVAPFITDEMEGLDVNTEFDWWKAERLLNEKKATLPEIKNY